MNKIIFYIKVYWKILLNNTIYKKRILKARQEWMKTNLESYSIYDIHKRPLIPEECFTKEITEEDFNRIKNPYNA